MTIPRTAPAPAHVRPATSGPVAGRGPWWLSVAVTTSAAVASTLGLLVAGVDPVDPATTAMLRGFDAVTLAVVVPGMALALRAARRGSLVATLLVASGHAYLVYTYAYALLGAGFDDLLLVHAAVFSGALAGLVLTLASLDPTAVAARLGRAPARAVAAVLGLLALALGGMWVAASVAYAVSGTIPAGSALVETDTVVHLGLVLDLTSLVPLYATAAALLWRRLPWGYVLAVLALVPGLLHQVGYVAALAAQSAAGVPGAMPFDPVEPVIVLLYAAATTALFVRRRAPLDPGHPVGQ